MEESPSRSPTARQLARRKEPHPLNGAETERTIETLGDLAVQINHEEEMTLREIAKEAIPHQGGKPVASAVREYLVKAETRVRELEGVS